MLSLLTFIVKIGPVFSPPARLRRRETGDPSATGPQIIQFPGEKVTVSLALAGLGLAGSVVAGRSFWREAVL